MQKICAILLVVVMVVSASTFAFAGEKPAATKLTRGAKNLILGWTEIPKNIVDTTNGSNAIAGISVGTLKGIAQAVARTVSGAVDVVTFPIGAYDKPVLKPAMVPEETK